VTAPAPDDGARTVRDFGEQWTRYGNADGYLGSPELLADSLEPFLRVEDVRGLRVAEIGSGTGRVVGQLMEAGAASVLALEPSAAFEVLVRNTARYGPAVRCERRLGSELPPLGDLDLVVSLGVLHHIPDPLPAAAAALRALRPGGRFIAWLYGKEGNEAYLAVARPMRAVTTRLPHPLLAAAVWTLYPLLRGYMALARVAPFPMRDYVDKVLRRLSPAQLRLTIYDQLNPRYAKYYTRDEALRLLTDAGFADVQARHRHGYSWLVAGTSPGPAGAPLR
jgi:SAM-dependent methyltransferase